MNLLFLVFLLPIIGFVTLGFGRTRFSENVAAVIGVGTIGGSATLTALIAWQFYQLPAGETYTQLLWNWMSVDGFSPRFALRLDQLSMLMMCVITGVGFFIHLFASWYMRGDIAFTRFFAYMNLFVASMLFLVLGDNLLFLYFGWEGVGLASYLLIGFWYKDPANGAAARKAFVVTRVGDTFMAIGLFILFHALGTLDIQEVLRLAPQHWHSGDPQITAAALLLLGGAVGKSAQLPLQTWLPDAMAGPTPVSALIHAATMVTAGVYLIARTHVLFELAPIALCAVGWTGGLTLLMAGFIALTQSDIKKILAYSTMSQIGYMFLALGAGAYQPAVFHLMTHAFFKALLFLSAGSVILACHHEQDIFKMGGLRKSIPFTFWVFLIGSLGLIAFPLTSGFFSKDEILFQTWAYGHHELYWIGLAGAFMTALYTFRLIFIAFFGAPHVDEHGHAHEIHKPHGVDHSLPLAVLAIAALFGGLIHIPLDAVLPQAAIAEEMEPLKHALELRSVLVSFAGIFFAWMFFYRHRAGTAAIKHSPLGHLIFRFWRSAFGFDWLYDHLFVKPYLFIVHINRRDVADQLIGLLPKLSMNLNSELTQTQTGQLRWYAATTAAGAIAVIAVVILPMILLWLILIPFIGGLLSWQGERFVGRGFPRWVALATMLLALGLSVWLWVVGDYSLPPIGGVPQWTVEYQVPWIPRFGISLHLALDGLSIMLVVLTNLLGVMAVACSWREIDRNVGFFHLNLLWNLGGVVGVFLTLDLFLFFFLWEMMLVPMYFLIALWGHNSPGGKGRIYAATKFFIFTQASGLIMLLAIIGLVFAHYQQTGIITFDYMQLLGTTFAPHVEMLLMLGFFLAFAVKTPMVPLHSWLPDAHSQAPTAGSVDLAGILLKTAAYGMLRFALPLFPTASHTFAPVAMSFGVIGILYGAFLCFSQNDIKRLVAYSSVSHMGFVLVGIYAGTEQALQGVVVQMLAHGLSAGALFILCGEIYERIHTRELSQMGGLWARFPNLPPIALFFAVAALGLPGLGNFVGEFLILLGSWTISPVITTIAATGLVLGAVYSLILVQRAFHGAPAEGAPALPDLGRRELAMMAVLMLLLLALGLFPQPVLDTSATAMKHVHTLYSAAAVSGGLP